MKLTQKSFFIDKINIDFSDRDIFSNLRKSNTNAHVELSRGKNIGKNKADASDVALKIDSTYVFIFGSLKQEVVFRSIFNVDADGSEVNIDSEKMDEIVSAIITPQEVNVLKDIFSKFGVNLGEGVPFGNPFSME